MAVGLGKVETLDWVSRFTGCLLCVRLAQCVGQLVYQTLLQLGKQSSPL